MPRREQFIWDVRRALRDLQPTPVVPVEGGRPARSLSLDAWATPAVVQHFDADDFANDDPHNRLSSAVERFRSIVASLPGDAPLTPKQRLDGEQAFRELAQVLREIVLSEWQSAAADLIRQTEAWCAASGWRTRRKAVQKNETLLDAYELSQLLIYDEQDLFVFAPIARFIPNGCGAYELSIQPSFERSSVYRDFDGVWYGHVDLVRGQLHARREPWSQEILRECLEELRALV